MIGMDEMVKYLIGQTKGERFPHVKDIKLMSASVCPLAYGFLLGFLPSF